jgi:1-deoxy-D-xylulose-5-phosphate synthase
MLDIGFLRMLPNMIVIAPSCESELKAALEFAAASDKPVAIRYPRDLVCTDPDLVETCSEPFVCGKSLTIKEPEDKFAVVAIGSCVPEAIKAAGILQKEGINVGVINARFAKPIDEKIIDLLQHGKTIITAEDHSIACGFGSAIMEMATMRFADAIEQIHGRIVVLGCDDEFIKAGPRSVQLEQIGVSAEAIAEKIRRLSGNMNG